MLQTSVTFKNDENVVKSGFVYWVIGSKFCSAFGIGAIQLLLLLLHKKRNFLGLRISSINVTKSVKT